MNSIPEADMTRLLEVAGTAKRQKHDRNVVAASKPLADMIASFDALIEAAPEQSDAPPAAPTEFNLVRLSNGWGEKYIDRIELVGEQWLQAFADAKEMVASGALVALLQERGTGKTQMAAEIARGGAWPTDRGEWNGNSTVAGRTALYRRAMDVFLDLRDAQRNDSGTSEKEVIKPLENCGLLVIDEFQERGGTPWEDRVLTNLLDKRYAGKRPTIIIANFTRQDLAKALSPSVRDRMHENGKSFTFDWPSFRRQPKL